MTNICVFCGSRSGNNPSHSALTTQLGTALGQGGHRLIYGGGRVGLMGLLANAAIEAGGEVVGVIPESLMEREVAHGRLHRLEVVSDMLGRKQRMIELADGFIALPGGLGTLDELFEVMTWQQLGLMDKPICLLDDGDYFSSVLQWLDQSVSDGFMDVGHREQLQQADTPEQAIQQLTQPRTSR